MAYWQNAPICDLRIYGRRNELLYISYSPTIKNQNKNKNKKPN